jgi:hypothetical protein
MCKCDKCGGNTCEFCGRGDCKGKSECLEAKVQRLEKKVKELEARPAITINPAPVYPCPNPYVPYRVYPYWESPVWREVTSTVTGAFQTDDTGYVVWNSNALLQGG